MSEENSGSGPADPADEYDRQHGHPTLADTNKPVGLSEASNKPAPHDVPFTVTGGNKS